MFRRSLTALILLGLLATNANAGTYWEDDPPGKLRKWCERPLISASVNLHRNPVEKLTDDLRKQLDRMKIKGAKAQVALEGDKVTVLVTYLYPQPKRTVVGGTVINGVVIQRIERIEYGWRVHVSARKGKLVTSTGGPVSEDYSY
jgi:hypothetical protein